MKKILGIVLFLALPIHSFAQDKLPPCSGNFIQSDWSNCQGKYDWGSYTYTGGFSKNKPHGRGEKRKSDGTLLVDGIWHEGELKKDLATEIKLQAQQAKLEFENLQKETQERQRLSLQKVDSAYAQSNLPACQGSDVFRWTNCFGTLIQSGGMKYIGEFKDGKYNGQGTLYTSNGVATGQGLWAEGKFVSSAFAQSNLPACQGNDFRNLNNCFGTHTFPDGSKYVGEWKASLMHGRGTFTSAKGVKYEGEWKDSYYNGQGTLFASNGSVINEGIWADGKLVRSAPVQQAIAPPAQPSSAERDRLAPLSKLPACPTTGYFNNCFGTFVFPSGERYVGEFRDNLRHGQGAFFTSSGLVVNDGLWSDGKFVRQLSVQQANSQTAQPSSAERDRFNAEIEVERKKRQELEQQLAAAKERERITAELDQERKKRQELETQLAASPQPSSPQAITPRRVAHALVIGNGAYPGSGRLDNPVNDANAISQKLRSMGFTVTTVTDANRQRLVQSMAQFRRTAASADISLLYYAGHGVQIFGTNYILPTDVDQTDPAQATIQGVSLNSVVENFLPGKTKLVFLDACRDNALQRTNDRSVSKGLAPISAAEGTLISYATKDGQTAADGVGSKNSPFTQALLEHLNDPQDIAVVLRKVRERVMKITGGKQQPWEYGSLTGGELVLSAIKPK